MIKWRRFGKIRLLASWKEVAQKRKRKLAMEQQFSCRKLFETEGKEDKLEKQGGI